MKHNKNIDSTIRDYVKNLEQRNAELLKILEHIALAVGDDKDKMSCWESVDAIIAENKILKAAILQITYKCKTDNIIQNKYIEGTDLSQFKGVVLAYKDKCYFDENGTLRNADGTRSIFDDVDE